MKAERIAAASVVIAAVLFGAFAAVAQQSNDATNQTGQTNQSTQASQDNQSSGSASAQAGTEGATTGNAATGRNLSKLDDKTPAGTARVSKLTGANLKNANGDSVGEIKDLVIDGSGKVRYAVVTYGGFLGIGSKMFAVPFEAFRVRQNPNDPNDRGDYVLTLDVKKEQLDGAQGFDNDNWPNFADTKFMQELDRRYNVRRNSSSPSRSQQPQ